MYSANAALCRYSVWFWTMLWLSKTEALVMLTTDTIVKQILQFKDVEQVYICGGGARNEFVVQKLESALHECELFTTDELGVEADAVEAMAFAWLAYAHINNIQGSVASVTGATKGAVLGTFCPGRE